MAADDTTDTGRAVRPATDDRLELFGLRFSDAESERAIADEVLARSPRIGRPSLLVTPNVDILTQLRHPGLQPVRHVFEKADWVLADGWPIVTISRFIGPGLTCRLAGSTVFTHFWPDSASAHRSTVALVSSAAVADGLAEQHDRASFVVAPMMEATTDGVAATAKDVLELALEVDAEFIVSAIGFPRDGLVADQLLDHWPHDRPAPVVMCLGASGELHLGLRRRAPEWVQRNGLEWLYRFGQEPRRLFNRYFIRSARFLPLALREVARR